MRCTVCGSALQESVTDLPFKVGDKSIVILKGVPVLHCAVCPEYLLSDSVHARVDVILSTIDVSVELEVVTFAA